MDQYNSIKDYSNTAFSVENWTEFYSIWIMIIIAFFLVVMELRGLIATRNKINKVHNIEDKKKSHDTEIINS